MPLRISPIRPRLGGDEGHEIIALVADRFLDPAVREKIAAMIAADTDNLTAHDIASEATWADRYRDSAPVVSPATMRWPNPSGAAASKKHRSSTALFGGALTQINRVLGVRYVLEGGPRKGAAKGWLAGISTPLSIDEPAPLMCGRADQKTPLREIEGCSRQRCATCKRCVSMVRVVDLYQGAG